MMRNEPIAWVIYAAMPHKIPKGPSPNEADFGCPAIVT
jgi:hypothetical protein